MIRRLAALAISIAYWVGMRLWDGVAGLWGGNRRECVILYFHGVSDRQAERFRRQMQWLASRKKVVCLADAASASEGSDRPRNCVTFDDGLESVRRNALPILLELRLPATVFVVAGNLGRKPAWLIPDDNPERDEILSTMQELREYPTDLVEIGSHTMSHAKLTEIPPAQVRNEFAQSKSLLEGALGYSVRSLSVPYGEYDAATLESAREVGFREVVTCDAIVVAPGDSLMGAGRLKTSPDDWPLEFRLKACGAYRWRRILRRNGTRIASTEPVPPIPASASAGEPSTG